jgi:thiol-disulfide isomerase/thioredoxin
MPQSLHIGSFVVPLTAILLIAAIGIATFVARRTNAEAKTVVDNHVYRVALVGLVCARAFFVIQFSRAYFSAPLDILDIRDGGWTPQAGVIGAWLYVLLLMNKQVSLRGPMLAAMAIATILWIGGTAVLAVFSRDTLPLPKLAFTSSQGRTVALQSFLGKPTVINVWATWCPPCQREMPLLSRAQSMHPDVHFVFLNQGESAQAVQTFLAVTGLSLSNVLLDPQSTASKVFQQQGLPATFFFDAHGKLVESRLGELSQATLSKRLGALRLSHQ